MFTGLIEEVGRVQHVRRTGKAYQIEIQCHKVLEGIQRGDSIAVNGVCLTVIAYQKRTFQAEIMPETLRKTHAQKWGKGHPVNLERAMCFGARMGGHMVSGHVDEVLTVRKIKKEGNAIRMTFSSCKGNSKVLPQGSVAIDGISLTVADVQKQGFTVSLIPHTMDETTLLYLKIGDSVNVEYDHIVASQKLTMDFFKRHGF